MTTLLCCGKVGVSLLYSYIDFHIYFRTGRNKRRGKNKAHRQMTSSTNKDEVNNQ